MNQPKTWVQPALVPPEPDGHFVMIPLSMGKCAIVDEADAELVLSYGKWFAMRGNPSTDLYYAVRNKKRGGIIRMHALIAGPRMDHVNRNGLDNRRINLRPATRAQNRANGGPSQKGTSGFKGVSLVRTGRRRRRPWVATIRVDGRPTQLGYFATAAEAARAYNQAALGAWGEFAWLNLLPADLPPVAPRTLPQTSDYRGVAWHRARGKWVAYISVDGRRVHLGAFTDEAAAARAYNRAALEAWGALATLNPVPEVPGRDERWVAPPPASQPAPSRNTSGYKGVSWHKGKKKWFAYIRIDGRVKHLGSFDDPADAARVYNRAALEAYGTIAWLNPVPDAPGPPAA